MIDLSRLTSIYIDSFIKYKESFIINKCEELGLPIPTVNDMKTRFNPWLIEEHKGYGELYYYNDGSVNGKFIIGFTEFKEPDWFADLNHFSLTYDVITIEPDWNKK